MTSDLEAELAALMAETAAADAAAERFHPRVVCAVAGVPPPTLQSWANKRWLDGLDGIRTERGVPRGFTASDALAIVLIRAAKDCGVASPEIVSAAPMAAKAWLAGKARELHVRHYRAEDRTEVAFQPSAMAEEATPDPDVVVGLNLQSIFAPALAALRREAAAEAAHAPAAADAC